MNGSVDRAGATVSGPDQAMRLHRVLTAYLSSKALFSAVRLGVFDVLANGPATAEQVASKLALPARSARVLLLALAGEDLVSRVDGQYRNTAVAAEYLVSTAPKYLGALAGHQEAHFAKMVDLTDALRSGEPVRLGAQYTGEFDGGPLAWARRWAEVFRASSQLMAEDLAGALDLTGRRHLVDLGCASGSYAMALARAFPHLAVSAVDQPAVAEVAGTFVAEAGLTGRVDVQPGNIFTDRYPQCDVALLSHVIQGFGPPRARELLAHVYQWLAPGGLLVVHSHLPEQARLPFPYQFGLILLINNTQGGEAHDEAVTTQWLTEVGFTDLRVREVSPISAVLTAIR